MKKMHDIRKQSEKELTKMLWEERAALRQFRFDIAGSKVKNIKGGANHKKTIARILTEMALRKNAA
jgi:ribosomal protein L29